MRFQDIFQVQVKTTNQSCGSILDPLKPEWEFPKEGGMGQLRLLWMLQSLQASSKMSVQQWPGRKYSGLVSGIRMLPWKKPKSHVENWDTQRAKIFFYFHPENWGNHPIWLTPQKKLTCPLKRDYFNREYIFQPLIFRGHSSVFRGVYFFCDSFWCSKKLFEHMFQPFFWMCFQTVFPSKMVFDWSQVH